MFYWPFDHRWLVFLLTSVAVAALAYLYGKTKKPLFYQALGAVAALYVLFFLVGLVFKTPSQQIERHLQEMSLAIKAKKPDDVMKHFADDFQHGTIVNKGFVAGQLKNALETEGLQEVTIWNVEVEPAPTEAGAKPTYTASFRLKGVGFFGQSAPLTCKAIFVRQADGQWKLKDFETPRDLVTNQPISIPNIGQ